MKYRFRLEKALHFTRLKETVKKIEVATTIQRVEMLKVRQQAMETELRTLLDEVSRSPDPARAPYQTSRIGFDTEELKRLAASLSKEEGALLKLRADLGRLAMRRKALEALKEKRAHEFEIARGRKQQLELDEAFRLLQKKGQG